MAALLGGHFLPPTCQRWICNGIPTGPIGETSKCSSANRDQSPCNWQQPYDFHRNLRSISSLVYPFNGDAFCITALPSTPAPLAMTASRRLWERASGTSFQPCKRNGSSLRDQGAGVHILSPPPFMNGPFQTRRTFQSSSPGPRPVLPNAPFTPRRNLI